MPKFFREIDRILTDKGLNRSAYSREIGYATSGLVYQVLDGTRVMPLEQLDEWLKPLGIAPGSAEYNRLRRLAYEDYAPPHVMRLINQITYEVGAFMTLVDRAMRERGMTPPPLPDLWPDVATAAPRQSQRPATKQRRRAKPKR